MEIDALLGAEHTKARKFYQTLIVRAVERLVCRTVLKRVTREDGHFGEISLSS
jgi:transposase